MRLLELFAEDRILVPLDAATLPAAAAALTEVLIDRSRSAQAAEMRALLEDQLPHDVLLAGGAFILRCRTTAVDRLTAALGVAAAPVIRERDPQQSARVVVILAGPPRETPVFLQAVSTLVRLMEREAVVQELLAARSPADVLALPSLAQIELPGYLAVRDVMTRRVVSVRQDTTLGEAAGIMASERTRALPVVSEGDEVLGMVSHRELLHYLIPLYVKRMSSGELRAPRRGSSDTDPHDLPVREVMDRSIMCLSEDQTIAEVAGMMLNRDVERYPVVRDGRLVGVITREDIVRSLLGR